MQLARTLSDEECVQVRSRCRGRQPAREAPPLNAREVPYAPRRSDGAVTGLSALGPENRPCRPGGGNGISPTHCGTACSDPCFTVLRMSDPSQIVSDRRPVVVKFHRWEAVRRECAPTRPIRAGEVCLTVQVLQEEVSCE